jgi:GNAT superfamily N-acetyltransferase
MAPEDGSLLRAATLLNLNWAHERLDDAQMDADPHLARYYDVDFARGDYGVMASADGEPIGVAWVRYFTADEPGYGFVRLDVPEMAVCVFPGYRGKGVGIRMLDAVLHEARHRLLAEISLSVEEGNPARRLYERFGFTPVEPALQAGTMSLVLTSATRTGDLSH